MKTREFKIDMDSWLWGTGHNNTEIGDVFNSEQIEGISRDYMVAEIGKEFVKVKRVTIIDPENMRDHEGWCEAAGGNPEGCFGGPGGRHPRGWVCPNWLGCVKQTENRIVNIVTPANFRIVDDGDSGWRFVCAHAPEAEITGVGSDEDCPHEFIKGVDYGDGNAVECSRCGRLWLPFRPGNPDHNLAVINGSKPDSMEANVARFIAHVSDLCKGGVNVSKVVVHMGIERMWVDVPTIRDMAQEYKHDRINVISGSTAHDAEGTIEVEWDGWTP